MGKRKKEHPRIIPEQDKRICGGICLCQLTVVLSSVALMYLTVAVYMPSHRAFKSGFETRPVMCQTTNTSMQNNCNWASCGEWCLTRTSGFCPQMQVHVRRNGTDFDLEGCSRIYSVSCPPVNMGSFKKINCNNGTECSALTGFFNCSLGHCANMSELFLCHYKADGIQIDSERDNMKLNGFFECKDSRCTKVKTPFSCDRYCNKITTAAVNVFVSHDDNIFTAYCERGYALTEANGTEEGRPIEPTRVWNGTQETVLMMSCHTVTRNGTSLHATDCTNGTIVPSTDIGKPFINFTTYWSVYSKSIESSFDPQHRYLPSQTSLIIYNNSRLYINLEGCVNTLRGECKDFLATHGRDGKNQTAQSRFPCFYNKKDPFFVIARFDLEKTWRELAVATVVPSVLFVISFITLCVITQSVKVGDDAKMRCKCCSGEDAALDDAKHEMPLTDQTVAITD